jgi:hypothetical protein
MSIMSLTAGASLKTRLFPVTVYELVGICTTPFNITNTAAVVLSRSNVNVSSTPLAVEIV